MFHDLDFKEAKKYFKKFVKKWNSGKLEKIFYDEEKLIAKYDTH